MINFKQLFEAKRAYKDGRLGDFAILKVNAFGIKINPDIEEQMQPVVGYFPNINLDKLHKLADGSFGKEYSHHMKKNKLKPFNISKKYENLAKKNVFALRYAVTHDIFHLLLGFDTTYAGEIGVLAFATEQKYTKGQKYALAIAKILYPLLAPRQFKLIRQNTKQGKILGNKIQFLLSYKFEEHWEKPLSEMRRNLGFE